MTETMPNPDQQTPQGGSDQQVDWQARYSGQQAKLQQQAATIQQLSTQIATLQNQVVDLTSQLSVKDGERTTVLGQKDQSIQTLTQELTTLKAEVARLQGLTGKLEIVKKLGRPELINVMDAVPASDPAAMEAAFNAMVGFADSLVQQRERQLTAGVTPTGGGNTVASASLPTNSADWEKHINSLPLGSKEREKAMDEWFSWTRK